MCVCVCMSAVLLGSCSFIECLQNEQSFNSVPESQCYTPVPCLVHIISNHLTVFINLHCYISVPCLVHIMSNSLIVFMNLQCYTPVPCYNT